MEVLIPLLVMGILMIPILIAIVLIVYIVKTNRLSRSTSALEAEVAALKTELARLRRSSPSSEYDKDAQLEATGAVPSPQAASDLAIDATRPRPSRIEGEITPPSVATAGPPRDAEVYVSPFRPQTTREPGEKSARPSQPGADSIQREPDRPAPASVSGSAQDREQRKPTVYATGSGSPSSIGYGEAARAVARPSRTRAEWESLIGGRLLNWIGALAIIIGIGFFLGYGYENNWITPPLLVGIGAIAGVALLAGGDLSFRKGYRIFSQGLIGAGISILYLSVYASFNYFHFQGQAAAFLMMCSVTVLTFVQAFRFNSLSVSLLGWAGGFLTPVLLSTGQANEAALFAYISILDAGLLAIVAFKTDWVILQPLTLGATYALYILWYVNYYDSEDLSTTAVLLTIFWGLFHALDVLQIVRTAKNHLVLREAVAVLNALCYYGALYVIVDAAHHDYLATVTLGLGAAYLVTIAAIRGLHPPWVTEARFALTGAVLLVIATGLRFSGLDTVFCWSMEALALVLAAVYWKEPGVLWGALLLYLAAVVKLFATVGWYSYGTPESFVAVLNKRAFAFLGLGATGALGAEAIRRAGRAGSSGIAGIFDYSWCLFLFVLIGLETQDGFGHLISVQGDREWLQFAAYLAIGVAWMVYALALTGYGTERGLSPPLNIGLFVTGASITTVAIAGFSYEPIIDFHLIGNIRAGAFAVELIGLMILLGWSAERTKWPPWAHGAFLCIFSLLILVLCTAETKDYFGKILDPMHQQYASDLLDLRLDQALRKYTNLQQVALSLVWLIYSILLIGYGIWRRKLSLRIIAIAVFGIAILKIFIYDLSFLETLYRIFSFIGLGLILLSVSFLYQRFKSAIFEANAQPEPES
jgi:uncharacterized membrane protein